VQKKVEGQEITVTEEAAAGGGAQIIDLMEALRASLGKKAAAPQAAPERAETRKPPKRAPAAASTKSGKKKTR